MWDSCFPLLALLLLGGTIGDGLPSFITTILVTSVRRSIANDCWRQKAIKDGHPEKKSNKQCYRKLWQRQHRFPGHWHCQKRAFLSEIHIVPMKEASWYWRGLMSRRHTGSSINLPTHDFREMGQNNATLSDNLALFVIGWTTINHQPSGITPDWQML